MDRKWIKLSEEDKKKVGPIRSEQENKMVGDVRDQGDHRKSNFLLYFFEICSIRTLNIII